MRSYRAIPIGRKDFEYGSYVSVVGKHYIVRKAQTLLHSLYPVPYVRLIEVIPETVGQSTGVPDKNDAKIYKGDKIEYCGHKLYEVVWDSCAYYKLREINPDTPEWKRDCIDFVETAKGELEIIGNIHKEKTNEQT